MMRVEIFHFPFASYENYVSLCFPFGECTRYFSDPEGKIINGDYAFPHVLARYIFLTCGNAVRMDVNENTVCFTASFAETRADRALENLIGTVCLSETDRAAASHAITDTKRAFAACSEDAVFCGVMKIQEGTCLRKGFLTEVLAENVQNMTVQRFDECRRKWVRCLPAAVSICGAACEAGDRFFLKIGKALPPQRYTPAALKVPAERIENAFINKGYGAGPDISGLYLLFRKETPMADRLVLLLFLSQILPGSEKGLQLDFYDASITAVKAAGEFPRKEKMKDMPPQQFEIIRQNILREIRAQAARDPAGFSALIARLCYSGISFCNLLQLLVHAAQEELARMRENEVEAEAVISVESMKQKEQTNG